MAICPLQAERTFGILAGVDPSPIPSIVAAERRSVYHVMMLLAPWVVMSRRCDARVPVTVIMMQTSTR